MEEKILVLKKDPYSLYRYVPSGKTETSAVELETLSGNMKLTFAASDAMCASLMQMATDVRAESSSSDYFSMWASMMHTLCHTVPDLEMFQDLMLCYKNYLARLADIAASDADAIKGSDADDLRAVAASLGVPWTMDDENADGYGEED